jgi:hypothetical protein
MVVGFTLTLWVQIPLRRGVLDTTLCDKVCHWFSPGTPVSSANKTQCHDITEIFMKVVLNTRTLTLWNIQGIFVFSLLYFWLSASFFIQFYIYFIITPKNDGMFLNGWPMCNVFLENNKQNCLYVFVTVLILYQMYCVLSSSRNLCIFKIQYFTNILHYVYFINVYNLPSSNPQPITLWLLSTHHLWVNWQRNPRSHVIVLKHWLNLKKQIPCKLREPPFFCITFSPLRRRLTISNDAFDWLLLIAFFSTKWGFFPQVFHEWWMESNQNVISCAFPMMTCF